MSKEFCAEHETMKVCVKGGVSWYKFISTLLVIIGIAVGVTTTISSKLASATEKVEERSISRDAAITDKLQKSIDKLEPMGKNITAICTRLGINER